MPALRRIARALLLLLLTAGCGDGAARRHREAMARVVVRPPAGEEVRFGRVPENGLWVERQGVMVIRENSVWRRMWYRYAPRGPGEAPELDFSRQMVAAVSMGGLSSCSSSASYVDRVERGRDSVFVVIDYAAYPQEEAESVCAQYVAPVDLLVLPRSDLPVAFVGSTDHARVPPPARWLEPYTAADTDTMVPESWQLGRLGLARDPSTPRAELAALVTRLEQHRDPETYDALVRNPRVRTDPALMARLDALAP